MRKIILILVFGILLGVGWWFWDNGELDQYIGNRDIPTLEARYTAEQIMQDHRKELLIDDQRSFQDPALTFYPYAYLEVKFPLSDKKTREGIILWGLYDGEMVLDTSTWEKTHGFHDALMAGAARNDFKIMNALATANGYLDREDLLKQLHVETELADQWIDQARQKHLIIQQGNGYQLHFENPKLVATPETKMHHYVVSKPNNHSTKVSAKYSMAQIEKMAQFAFGADFTIRHKKEIYLPVYSIEVLNPDGSIMTSYWNALSGKKEG